MRQSLLTDRARHAAEWHARLMARVMSLPTRPGARILFHALMRDAGLQP